MPNIKSAEKRVSVSATKKLQNQMIRSQMQTAVKKFNAAIAEGDVEAAKKLLPLASSKIDNAATKNVIHKNAANRKKAQIAKALSQLERPQSAQRGSRRGRSSQEAHYRQKSSRSRGTCRKRIGRRDKII